MGPRYYKCAGGGRERVPRSRRCRALRVLRSDYAGTFPASPTRLTPAATPKRLPETTGPAEASRSAEARHHGRAPRRLDTRRQVVTARNCEATACRTASWETQGRRSTTSSRPRYSRPSPQYRKHQKEGHCAANQAASSCPSVSFVSSIGPSQPFWKGRWSKKTNSLLNRNASGDTRRAVAADSGRRGGRRGGSAFAAGPGQLDPAAPSSRQAALVVPPASGSARGFGVPHLLPGDFDAPRRDGPRRRCGFERTERHPVAAPGRSRQAARIL